MKPQFQGHGFQTPFIKEDEYLFGKLGALGITKKPLRPLGGWKKFLPLFEHQSMGFETSNCTAFGSTNAIEVLQLVQFNEVANYSDRALGIMSGTTLQGNTPQVVLETVRNNGLAFEETLPMSKTAEEYYANLTDTATAEGRRWVRKYKFNHEWTFTPFYDEEEKKENLIKSLEFSPIPVAVYAWWKEGVLYKKPVGATANHWCMLFDYDKGHWWAIYDSYEESVKLLDWNYEFEFAKSISLEKKPEKKCFLSLWS